MTDSSIIQQARDVLAKWREAATPGEWDTSYDDGFDSWDIVQVAKRGSYGFLHGRDVVENVQREGDVDLIVGTAGNPELLDAIDEELRWGLDAPTAITRRIAAAIIAAHERMSA